MKKLFVIFSLVLFMTGCSVVKINNQSYSDIIDSILTNKTSLKNVSLEGYSYYLPKGVLVKKTQGLNSVLYYNHRKMYLYVDALSYYHKVDGVYEKGTKNYYAQEIDINGKKGYLEITQIYTKYFVEFMYNYSKIEAYTSEEELKKTVTTMAYILNSVEFKDSILSTLIGDNTLNYNEENFNIFKPKREEGSFLDYVEEDQQDSNDDYATDEDQIEFIGQGE
ncbi:MAG: hypothetical protein E7168_01850 [Firmicutes bacterium]|nr:hypothetical protein [Bacillota bacterium]